MCELRAHEAWLQGPAGAPQPPFRGPLPCVLRGRSRSSGRTNTRGRSQETPAQDPGPRLEVVPVSLKCIILVTKMKELCKI